MIGQGGILLQKIIRYAIIGYLLIMMAYYTVEWLREMDILQR